MATPVIDSVGHLDPPAFLYERRTEFFLELRRWQDMRYYEIIPPDWLPGFKSMGVHRRWPVSVLERGSNSYYTGG